VTASLRIEIIGTNLPGRTCGPGEDGRPYENVHVALRCRQEWTEWVRGDADEARWSFEVTLKGEPGDRDFGGPYIYGPKGARAVGLPWGEVEGEQFELFRAAKVMLDKVDPALVEQAADGNKTLVATLDLTDDCGHPRCAQIRPPAITWMVAPSSA
jgi:hypothetical protein